MPRRSNTHDENESTRLFNRDVSDAKRFYNRAGDLAREGDTQGALENLLHAAHWLGSAQAQLDYVRDYNVDNYDDYVELLRVQPKWAELFLDATRTRQRR